MKALTICQPYAELIMRGEKLVENRTWPTRYRGPLLIHAGKSRNWLSEDNYGIPISEMDFGFIVGVVKLVDCVDIVGGSSLSKMHIFHRWPWLDEHIHAEGPWCWILDGVQRFQRPITYRGAQGLFEIPTEVVAHELEALENVA